MEMVTDAHYQRVVVTNEYTVAPLQYAPKPCKRTRSARFCWAHRSPRARRPDSPETATIPQAV